MLPCCRAAGTCYAVSQDGVNWTKPSLGVIAWNGSTANNIVVSTEADNGRGVMKDTGEVDPSRRYKMFGQMVPFKLVNTTGPGNTTVQVSEVLGTSVSADGAACCVQRAAGTPPPAPPNSPLCALVVWGPPRFTGRRVPLMSLPAL